MKYKPPRRKAILADEFAAYGAMDRAHVVSMMFDEVVLEDIFVKAHPELRRQADTLSDALSDFYQRCGRAWSDLTGPRNGG